MSFQDVTLAKDSSFSDTRKQDLIISERMGKKRIVKKAHSRIGGVACQLLGENDHPWNGRFSMPVGILNMGAIDEWRKLTSDAQASKGPEKPARG
ncbi:hypothetical protein MAP00_002374 [Monascus purpureus]|nr:hypothetical protein MAP00_002374 [Monascus purpureus]